MKKILSIALTIVMVFGVIACAPVSASAAYVYAPGDYTYNVGGTFYFEAPYDGWYAFESYDNYDPYLYVEYENGDEETFDDENGYEFRANIYLYEGEEIYCRVGTYEGADQKINFNIDAIYDVETNRDYTIASGSYFSFTADHDDYYYFYSNGENDPVLQLLFEDNTEERYDDEDGMDFVARVYLYEDESIFGYVYDYDSSSNDVNLTVECDCGNYEISKPETPIVSAANAVGGITVSWDWVAGATKYNVYRRAAGSSSWVYVGTTEGTSFFDKNVSNGKYYAYSVRAYNDAGRYSDYVAANTYTIKCVATPKLTKIQNATSGIRIDWANVPGATGYRVYRRGAGSTYWYYLGTTTNLWFVDSAVKNQSGNYYRYTVRAVSSYFSGFDTNGLYIKRLSDPGSIKAVNETSGIRVSWGFVNGAGGYRVYRRASGQNSWTFLGTTTQNNFIDTNVSSGTYYRYTVKAFSGSTYSSYSTSGALTIRLSNPGSLSSSQTTNGVKVAWGRVNGATSYRVYRRGAGESSWTYIGASSSTSLVDSSVRANQYYRYTVRAVNGNVYSGFNTNGTVIGYKIASSSSSGNQGATGSATSGYYILNTNSMKFHDPYCGTAANMSSANKAVYYGDRDDLIAQGYSPCGNCKP